MKIAFPILLAAFGLFFVACQQEELESPPIFENMEYSGQASGMSTSLEELGQDPCGDPQEIQFFGGQTIEVGTVLIANTEEYLLVSFELADGWMLEETHVYVGLADDLPANQGGNPQIGQFPYKEEHQPYLEDYTYMIPLADVLTDADGCYAVATHASVVLLDADGNVEQQETAWAGDLDITDGGSWATYFEFCTVECSENPPPLVGDCGLFRTQTQGGWGADPSGNNPGVYLHENFDGAFPDGLTIGCDFTVLFEGAQNVTDYLPDGGTAAVLDQNYVNPTGDLNVFVAQVTALSLSVGFDAYDPDFSESDTPLADLLIASGDFEGWTVGAILALAQEVLGGCNQDYTVDELNDVISSINENFVDGETDEGFLVCP